MPHLPPISQPFPYTTLFRSLDLEVAAGFESNKGAMERLGVENVQAKLQEIESERNKRRFNSAVSYGNEDVEDLIEEGGEDLEDGELTTLHQSTLFCRHMWHRSTEHNRLFATSVPRITRRV